MYCQNCGEQNGDAATFCVKCGAQITPAAGGTGAAPAPARVRTGLYAGFWKRFAAFAIDYIIVVIMAIVAGAIFGLVYGAVTADAGGAGSLGAVVGALMWWIYYALMESSQTQATLGKMALGIKVTGEDGARISFARATLRLLAKIVSGLLLAIGYLMVAFTKKKQGLHDMAASCLVVNANATEEQVRTGMPIAAAGMPWWAVVLIILGVSVFPLGIMAAIAIPAYQDFTVRAKVVDAMGGIYEARTAVAVYQKNHGKWPANLEDARRDTKSPESPASRHVERLEVEPHTGVIKLTIAGNPLQGKVIEFVPRVDGDNVVWRCRSDNVPPKYLPSNCRDSVDGR